MINGTQFITAILVDAVLKTRQIISVNEMLAAFSVELNGLSKDVLAQ
jgi:histidine ammonia-lyase